MEKEMGNRGSKSPSKIVYKESNLLVSINPWWYAYTIIDVLIIIDLSHLGVKEQRVDSSYYIKHNIVFLRYTLIGFERNYLVRILSNQNINKRLYSTINTSHHKTKPFLIRKSTEEKISTSQIVVLNSSLNPWFITGFTDGEGCFLIIVRKNRNLKIGWSVELRFQITLHEKDKTLLKLIQNYFCVGYINKDGPQSIKYCVQSIKELKVIIDHFDRYPLITQKWSDYKLFKEAYNLILNKEHLTLRDELRLSQKNISGGEIKKKIFFLEIKKRNQKKNFFFGNRGLTEELKAAFPQIILVQRPRVDNILIQDPNWIAGFTTGEGCFSVTVINSANRRLGFQVQLAFRLTQHSRDEELLKSLIEYYGCGNIYKDRETFEYRVIKFSDIKDKIIPFFLKYKIIGVKSQDFQDWCKCAEIVKKKDHLTAPPRGGGRVRTIARNKIRYE